LSRSFADRGFSALVWAGAGSGAAIVALILVFVAIESVPALREVGGARFLTDRGWYPAEGLYGLAPMILGSLAVTALALGLAGPAGVTCAVFCKFVAPPGVARVFRVAIRLLSGIPSVVIGLWGLVTVAPWIAAWRPPGQSLAAGGLILALMVLPTVSLTADAALGAVPMETLRGAAALGLGRWAIVWRVALPAARAGVLSGLVLALGRALGETMAVLMVCGNDARIPRSLFDPVRPLTSHMALEMAYAMGTHRSALFLSGLVLLLTVVVLVIGADRLVRNAG